MKPRISFFWSQIDCEKPSAVYIQARYERGVVGQLRLDINDKAGWIGNVFVQEDYRGKGLATLLFQTSFYLCRVQGFQVVGLTVHDENTQARKLYEKLGFLPYRKGYENYQEYVKPLL